MSRQKKGLQAISEDSVRDLLPAALARAGLAVPVTPEQVAQAEQELEKEPIQTPPHLRDPFAIFEPQTGRSVSTSTPPSSEVLEELRQAARCGDEISKDVRSRMDDDRAEAETERRPGGGRSD